jgi:hypothetical protein
VDDPTTATEEALGKLDSLRRPIIFPKFSSNFLNVPPKVIPRNRPQMVENEDGSEGNSSEAKTSDPDPADSSVGQLAAELSSPHEVKGDNKTIQQQDTTTASYAGPEETPTSGLEPSISRAIGWGDIAEPENRKSVLSHPNPLTGVVAPIAEALDDLFFQGTTTPDLAAQNEVHLEALMDPTAHSSSALLRSKAATDNYESDVANGEEAPQADPTELVDSLLAPQLDSTSETLDPVFNKPHVASREEEPNPWCKIAKNLPQPQMQS